MKFVFQTMLRMFLITLFIVLPLVDCGTCLGLENRSVNSRSGSKLVEDLIPLEHDALLFAAKGFDSQLKFEPNNAQLLQRAAFVHFRLGWLFTEKEPRKAHYKAFQQYATHAYDLTDGAYYPFLLKTVAKAKTIGYLSKAEKVKAANELARDAKQLVAMSDGDLDALHLLSWVHFEIGSISATNKFFASLLFGGLPAGMSVDKALILMETVIQQRPDYSVYRYDLGYYYWKSKRNEIASNYFQEVVAMKPDSVEESVYLERAKSKLASIHREQAAKGKKKDQN